MVLFLNFSPFHCLLTSSSLFESLHIMKFHTWLPKKCSAWTSNDLDLHNVKVFDTDIATFGINELPHPTQFSKPSSPLFSLSSENLTDALSLLDKADWLFFSHLHNAMWPHSTPLYNNTNSSFIINFTYHILNMLGFTGEEGDCIIWWHQDMPLFMCGQNRHTIADMWISHLTSETVLL